LLELTESTVAAVNELTASSPASGLRIFAAVGGRAGLTAVLVEWPAEDDEIIEADGARVYLDPGAADALEDKVLDTYVEGGRVHLALLERS
jgi:Fe-S cluster assembly iron-binding protein IscA